MEAAAIIANLIAALDAAQRVSALAVSLKQQYDTAKAAGIISAEQDAQITAAYDELRARGFKFD